MTTRGRTAEVSGQDRGSKAARARAGQPARRTFPPFGYKTAPGIGARPGLGLIVGQPRLNAPFLTHDHRCIPYGGIPGGIRRELNGRDSLLARRPPVDKRDIYLARPGYRAAVTKMADRCTRDGRYNDPLSLLSGLSRRAARGRAVPAPRPRARRPARGWAPGRCRAACAGAARRAAGRTAARRAARSPGRARRGCARRAWRCAARRRCCAGSAASSGNLADSAITSWCRPTSSSEWRRRTMRAASVSSVSRSVAASRLTAAARSLHHRGEHLGLVAVVRVQGALRHLGRGRELVDRARAVAGPQEDAEGGRQDLGLPCAALVGRRPPALAQRGDMRLPAHGPPSRILLPSLLPGQHGF